jgi:hypothetical protein
VFYSDEHWIAGSNPMYVRGAAVRLVGDAYPLRRSKYGVTTAAASAQSNPTALPAATFNRRSPPESQG